MLDASTPPSVHRFLIARRASACRLPRALPRSPACCQVISL